MNRDELNRLQGAAANVEEWSRQARAIMTHRAQIDAAAFDAAAALRARIVNVGLAGASTWRVLPLRDADSDVLSRLAAYAAREPLTAPELEQLQQLADVIPVSLKNARALAGLRRFFTAGKSKEAAKIAAQFLSEYHAWGSSYVPSLLARAQPRDASATATRPSMAAEPDLHLSSILGEAGRAILLPVAEVSGLASAVQTLSDAIADEADARRAAQAHGEDLRRAEAHRLVSAMPLDRLKDASRDRLSIAPLAAAGYVTVQDVLDGERRLAQLPGIGPRTAQRLGAAARALQSATVEEASLRLDMSGPADETHAMLGALAVWERTRDAVRSKSDFEWAHALYRLALAMDPAVTHLIVFCADGSVAELLARVEVVSQRAQAIRASATASQINDVWQDFESRPADYVSMLHELGFATEDAAAVEGDLPQDVIEAVRAFKLRTDLLTASLRGYQSFAARFALVQKKVIIGDEMGLGKTIEALAVVGHLHAEKGTHALVICPAAVVTNWVREVQSKTSLGAYRLHGPERDFEYRNWVDEGGVAVTTYETLTWFRRQAADAAPDLACVVVDEAHYVKNPNARRSAHVASILNETERAVLLTGTPLENRVDEFRTLVRYIRPDLAVDATDLRPRLFRQQVAPAYLRRNQEDVLTELPDLVEIDEWVPLSPADDRVYAEAVYSGNFMQMRQAAMLEGHESAKVRRLIEIVSEAEANGRKVLVFSNFLKVLQTVADALPTQVFGPLTGSVPAARRQAMIDAFANAGQGAVLVSQIQAGGVGLNIQAASVVVICEPQLKPTTEWQAIARAHRMGQLKSVQVHRLLSELGADRHITELLARKKKVFADYAAISETAESAADAFDITDSELIKEVVEGERLRLFPSGVPDKALASDALN